MAAGHIYVFNNSPKCLNIKLFGRDRRQ